MFDRIGDKLKATVPGIIFLSALGSALWAVVAWTFKEIFGILRSMDPDAKLYMLAVLYYVAFIVFGFVSTYWIARKLGWFSAGKKPVTAPVPQSSPKATLQSPTVSTIAPAPVPPPAAQKPGNLKTSHPQRSLRPEELVYANKFKSKLQNENRAMREGIRIASLDTWQWVFGQLNQEGILTEKEVRDGLHYGIIDDELNGNGSKRIDWNALAMEYRKHRERNGIWTR